MNQTLTIKKLEPETLRVDATTTTTARATSSHVRRVIAAMFAQSEKKN